MVVDLDSTHGLYHGIIRYTKLYLIIPNTTEFKIAITQSIFELGGSDFVW